MEEWKDIPGWEGFYQASSHGRIRSLDRIIYRKCRWGGDPKPHNYRGRIMNLTPYRGGYVQVGLRRPREKCVMRKVHHLVLESFGFPRPNNQECRHINGDRTDNRVGNLAWATHIENEADKVGHGTIAVGIKHGRSRLAEADVIAMRERYAVGELSQNGLAREYGVTVAAVRSIIVGENWRHIGGPITVGKRHHQRLNPEAITQIRADLLDGKLSQPQIAEKFGVSQSRISQIKLSAV